MREWLKQMREQAGIITRLLSRTVREALTTLPLVAQAMVLLSWSIVLVLLTLMFFPFIPLSAFAHAVAHGRAEERT